MTVTIHKSATLDEKARYYNEVPLAIEFRPSDMQNFYTKLPEGGSRFAFETLKNRFPQPEDALPMGERLSDEARARHSELYLGQTRDEFFASIDTAIEAVGVKEIENIKNLNVSLRNQAFALKHSDDAVRTISRKLIPLYLHLREKGYTHYDLAH